MSEHIQTRLDDGVLVVTFARAEKKNALTLDMYEGLSAALSRAAEDADVRIVLMHGDGGVFTAGNDLKDFMQRPPTGEDSPVARFLNAISTAPKPVIAAVEGVAIGIGSTLLLHADLVYASADARFKLPFVPLGLVPEGASSYLLPRSAGGRLAAELLFFGETFDAQTAVRAGLVSEVVAPGETIARAVERAATLAALPNGALMETKQLMRAGIHAGVKDALKREGELFIARLGSPEAMEAFTAFFEKRPPDFKKIKA